MEEKRILLLFTCDEWKSRDGMRLVCATTVPEKMKQAIAHQIELDSMVYTHGEMSDAACDASELLEDWDGYQSHLEDINDFLSFGFLEIAEDGEEL